MPLNNGCAASSSGAIFHLVLEAFSQRVRIVFSDVSAAAIYLFTLKTSLLEYVQYDLHGTPLLYEVYYDVHVSCKQLMTEGDLLGVYGV